MQKNITDHITQTYVNLRVGMAILAFSLPVLLMLGSFLRGEPLQPSISAFYHTPMRDLFVGILVAVGVCLYLYKGFSNKENIALNIAGVFAVAVAFLPTAVPEGIVQCASECAKQCTADCAQNEAFTAVLAHRISAFLFFVPVAYVCRFRGKDTVELIEDEQVRKKYFMLYRIIGPLIITLPTIAIVYSLLTKQTGVIVFCVEFAAIWAFALFWLVKVFELRHHRVLPELHVLKENR